jgi:hypothetical protein
VLEQLPIADNTIARAKPLIVVLRRQMGKAPPGIKIKHVIAAKLSVNRITAVRCQRRDHNQIAHLQMVFLAIAQAARFPLENCSNRELRVVMPLIDLLALPGAAQFQPRELFITPERLWNIPGVRHIASSLKVMIRYSTGRVVKKRECALRS